MSRCLFYPCLRGAGQTGVTADTLGNLPTPSCTQNPGSSIMVQSERIQNALISFLFQASQILRGSTVRNPKHSRLGLCSSGIEKSVSKSVFKGSLRTIRGSENGPRGTLCRLPASPPLSGQPSSVTTQPFSGLAPQGICLKDTRSLFLHLCTSPALTQSHGQVSCLVDINGITMNYKSGRNQKTLTLLFIN